MWIDFPGLAASRGLRFRAAVIVAGILKWGSGPVAAIFAGILIWGSGPAAVWAQGSPELEELRDRVDALTEQVNLASLELPQDDGVRLGGYAEMHYNAPGEGTTELDFHRFVLLVSKPINDWIFFNSEIPPHHVTSGMT